MRSKSSSQLVDTNVYDEKAMIHQNVNLLGVGLEKGASKDGFEFVLFRYQQLCKTFETHNY